MEIGQRIAALRRQRGMTQEQLAEHLGTTRQAVSKWESGKSSPDIDIVIAMGDLFGVSMDYLLLGKEDQPAQSRSSAPRKKYLPWYIVLLIFTVCLTLLLPLIAKAYQSMLMANEGHAIVEYSFYLGEWPLKGIVLIDIGMTFAGVAGLIYANRAKIMEYFHEWLP